MRYVVLWLGCTVITVVFAVVNYLATAQAGMFSGAAESLHGPKAARALLALAWYFQHFVWPIGLASWYPTPVTVRWSDPATIQALGTILLAGMLMGWFAVRSRSATWGIVWFFVTIASTVQLVPTRNALAADRYMYLPIIGLLWVTGLVLWRGYERAVRRWGPSRVGLAAIPPTVVAAVAMVGQSWHVASFYEMPTEKSRRIAELNPDTPHVWERVAWSYYRADNYDEAIAFAEREFVHEDHMAWSDAHQVIGMSRFRLGDYDAAIASLQRAMEADPKNSQAKYHLARVLEDLGRTEEALRLHEESVADAPLANPRICRLASLYRRLGRGGDARRMYEQVLRNNPRGGYERGVSRGGRAIGHDARVDARERQRVGESGRRAQRAGP
jgi:tetratricopeptide (TPR) repeat protein